MRVLVDTHALFWWVQKEEWVPGAVLGILEDSANVVLASPVTAWELATKGRLGKWPGSDAVLLQLDEWIGNGRLTELPITVAHAALAGSFPVPHRDPFDRMLAAQSRVEQVPLVTADPAFTQFGIDLLWS